MPAVTVTSKKPAWEGSSTDEEAGLPARDLNDLDVLLEHLVEERADGPVRELVLRALRAGGKRLRPLLVLLVAGALRAPREPALLAAAAAELIHTASLIHDDILDRSPVRRGQATIYASEGERTAVLAGDILFATAFSALARFKLYSVLDAMAGAVAAMCSGEINQARHRFDLETTVDHYLQLIDQKTSALVAAACRAGGLVAGARSEVIEAVSAFGHHLGTAFQVVDDLSDFLAQPAPLGKPTWSDLASGTLTLPVIYALADSDRGPRLRGFLADRGSTPAPLDGEARVFILDTLQGSGALQRALAFARQQLKAARRLLLANLPDSPQRAALLELLQKVVPNSFQ